MVHTQQPTCTNLRIRSTQDTHKIFYAIQKGILKMVTRRLDADERLALRSGCVYAWEERGPHSEITGLGIERFTEGRRWTPSRVRDEFLFYYERYMPPPDINAAASGPDAKPPRDWEPMVKQTYSVWVGTENGRRKWHLTAYFTQGTIDQLGTVDDIPGVGDLVVPEGVFKSTRVGKSRTKHEDGRSESSKSSMVTRTYAPFPSPYPLKPPVNEAAGVVSSQPVLMYEPYQKGSHSGYYHAQSQQTSQPGEAQTHSRGNSHSRSPKNRSPVSLSPSIPSAQTQYAPDRRSIAHHPPTHSYHGVPGASGHEVHSHPTGYLPSPAPSGVDHGHRENFVSSPWDVGNSVSQQNVYPSVSNQLQTATPDGSIASSGYGFSMAHSQDPVSPSAHPSLYQRPSSGELSAAGNYDSRSGSLSSFHHPSDQVSPYELAPTTYNVDDRGTSPARALAPLYALNRQAPYRRAQMDDKALRLLQNAPATSF